MMTSESNVASTEPVTKRVGYRNDVLNKSLLYKR
jgi:hypothetical protein